MVSGVMSVNDSCRFCKENLRVKGTLQNNKKVFGANKAANERSVSERLQELGLTLRRDTAKSIRICKSCFRLIGRIEDDFAVFRRWQEEEEKETNPSEENRSHGEPAGVLRCEKRDGEPEPAETSRSVKRPCPGPATPTGTPTGQTVDMTASRSLTERQDASAGPDRSPGQVGGTDTEVTVPETNAAVAERAALQHVVDEEAILQLMKNCPMCNRKCRCTKRICGPYLTVYQSCYFCNYQRKWASQPEATNISSYKTPTPAKRKPQQKDKVSVNTKVQTSLLDQTLET